MNKTITFLSLIFFIFSLSACKKAEEPEPLIIGHINKVTVEKKATISDSETEFEYKLNFLFEFAGKERSFRMVLRLPDKDYETSELIKRMLESPLSECYFPKNYWRGFPRGFDSAFGKKFRVHCFDEESSFSPADLFIVVYTKHVLFLKNIIKFDEGWPEKFLK